MRRGTALGLSATSLTTLVSAPKVAGQAIPTNKQPVGSSILVPESLRTDLAGQRITAVLTSGGPGKRFEDTAVQKFVEATGIQINNVSGAASVKDRLDFYLRILGAQASDIDVAMIDITWPGIMAHHALDLTDALQSQDIKVFEPIVKNNMVGDTLVGIPWHTDAGLLYYRTDLLKKYGYSEPPAAWTELQDMARAIQDGEKPGNPAFTGYVWQGAPYESLTCNGLEWQFSNGGGTIIEDDGTVSVNNEQAIDMFEMAKGWVGTISPTSVTEFMDEDAQGMWQGGNAAFMRNWSGAYSEGAAEKSVIHGRFGVTQLPMGNADGAQHAATLGGWQLMVSRYSQHADAAIEFTKYLTSRELQKAYAIELMLLPTITDLYSDPDVLAANPHFAELVEIFVNRAVTRPSSLTKDLYYEVSTAYSMTLNLILNGETDDAASAIEDLAGQLEDIMSEL